MKPFPDHPSESLVLFVDTIEKTFLGLISVRNLFGTNSVREHVEAEKVRVFQFGVGRILSTDNTVHILEMFVNTFPH